MRIYIYIYYGYWVNGYNIKDLCLVRVVRTSS